LQQQALSPEKVIVDYLDGFGALGGHADDDLFGAEISHPDLVVNLVVSHPFLRVFGLPTRFFINELNTHSSLLRVLSIDKELLKTLALVDKLCYELARLLRFKVCRVAKNNFFERLEMLWLRDQLQ